MKPDLRKQGWLFFPLWITVLWSDSLWEHKRDSGTLHLKYYGIHDPGRQKAQPTDGSQNLTQVVVHIKADFIHTALQIYKNMPMKLPGYHRNWHWKTAAFLAWCPPLSTTCEQNYINLCKSKTRLFCSEFQGLLHCCGMAGNCSWVLNIQNGSQVLADTDKCRIAPYHSKLEPLSSKKDLLG